MVSPELWIFDREGVPRDVMSTSHASALSPLVRAFVATGAPTETELPEGEGAPPLRVQLRRLEHEGLVEVTPRRGAIVTALDPATVSDLYDLRLILEAAAVRLAATGGRPLDRVDELMARAEIAVDEQPQMTFHRLDVQLHRALAELSGNAELATAVEHVHQRIQAVRVRCAVPGRLRIAQDQHTEIVEAVRAGNAKAAEAAVRRHITSAKKNVLGVLNGKTPPGQA
jgi:DNA-binding GntR family transcriptional regulator